MTRDEYIQKIDEAKMSVMPDPSTPQCCATCQWLSPDGRCEIFDEYPPIEYITAVNECPEYEIEIPF